jgi:hypothetical protein
MKRIVFLALTFSITHIALAQTDSAASKKPQFKLSLNYNSGLNYYGRTDSLKSSGFFPLAELWLTPTFYINAAPVFIFNSKQTFAYAGTITTMGFQKMTPKWFRNFYVLKPFYQQNTTLVQSALQAQAGFSLTRLNKIVNMTAGADTKWSNKLDIGASAGVDHIFRFEKRNHVLVIDPSANAYAGTQQVSKTYMVKKKGGLLQLPSRQEITETSNTFNILAYEFSMPVIYARGKWQVLATPSYVMPKHLLQVAGRPDLSEQGQNLFYGTLALKHTF